MRIPIKSIVFLAILAGIVFLQIFLSKKENKWLGLVFPITFFVFSLIVVLGNVMYTGMIGQVTLAILISLFIFNIPTIILLVIYFACKASRKKQTQLEKMNIQDL